MSDHGIYGHGDILLNGSNPHVYDLVTIAAILGRQDASSGHLSPAFSMAELATGFFRAAVVNCAAPLQILLYVTPSVFAPFQGFNEEWAGRDDVESLRFTLYRDITRRPLLETATTSRVIKQQFDNYIRWLRYDLMRGRKAPSSARPSKMRPYSSPEYCQTSAKDAAEHWLSLVQGALGHLGP